jgi:membrane-associated protease RseP (regulator of RpoE activity)
MNSRALRSTAWALALGLVAFSAIASPDAGTEKDKDKPVSKRRVVVVDNNGEQRVIEGDGVPVRRGYLGLGLVDLTPELRAHFGVSGDAGVMVSTVEAGSPAEKAGIKVGDILTSIDRDDAQTTWDVRSKVRGYDDGQQVAIEVVRDGRPQTLNVTMVQKERPELDLAPFFVKKGDGENTFFRLDPDAVKALEGLRNGDLPGGGRVQVFHTREAELEKQLKDLEKRIAELEHQLSQKK